jgi:hypothetical protein
LREVDAELLVQNAISYAENALRPHKVQNSGPVTGLNQEYYQGGLALSF